MLRRRTKPRRLSFTPEQRFRSHCPKSHIARRTGNSRDEADPRESGRRCFPRPAGESSPSLAILIVRIDRWPVQNLTQPGRSV
jgi:hypothetical protein